MPSLQESKLAFIGGGNMASAIIGGLVSKGVNKQNICVSEPWDVNREKMAALGVRTTTSNVEAGGDADLIIIAVKPQVTKGVCEELGAAWSPRESLPVVVSIAAGITLDSLQKWLTTSDGRTAHTVRVMPNTPALVGEGASGVYASKDVTPAEKELVNALLGSVSKATEWVEREDLLDVVTGLSGSGPAYFFAMVEHLVASATALGLPEEQATRLATQTCLGAGKMLVESADPPSQLRKNVTSPNGTTHAALMSFESLNFKDIVDKSGDDNSAASFEKTLSTLSTKIGQATTQLDQQRQSSRRFKALWTLYSTFAYLFYSIILALILGWESWGIKEYAAIGGGPVVIYAVRTTSSKVFNYRINRLQRHLDDLHKQREVTIEKLKVATKYNSTQQLLEKYGGASPEPSPNRKASGEKQKSPQQPQQPVARTGLPPPPTANIRRPPSSPQTPTNAPSPQPPSSPQELARGSPQFQQQPFAPPPYPQQPTEQAEFAPNAYSTNAGQGVESPHWYDRLLDVLLGEDETQPRNRMVMICTSCRLVNGQAPPGIKTPEELGRWRCGSCGAWNGSESETSQMLTTLRQENAPTEGAWEPVSKDDADTQSSEGTDEAVMVPSSEKEQAESGGSEAEEREAVEESTEPVRRSKRGAKGSKGK
ncbi:Pyrroline-5-carboxylate reductase [Penicillium nucicola]|uniref:Pyrroline-5-carboxylate reductase n=1 Tax=Penicillium nucicola TaxID=1850975 RepID=UPI002544F5A5|nr:Pyrroline-5-carboxylate reductase [Penicillium nucicola]KAJ5771063.1 Pyrroline-5-carboxylate reductase [Penicillium nucicola]